MVPRRPEVSNTLTKRSGWSYGKGSSSTPYSTLKMDVFTPMPRARVRMATSVKPGLLASDRTA